MTICILLLCTILHIYSHLEDTDASLPSRTQGLASDNCPWILISNSYPNTDLEISVTQLFPSLCYGSWLASPCFPWWQSHPWIYTNIFQNTTFYLHPSFTRTGLIARSLQDSHSSNCGTGLQNPLRLLLFLTYFAWRWDPDLQVLCKAGLCPLTSLPYETWFEVIFPSEPRDCFPLMTWGAHLFMLVETFVAPGSDTLLIPASLWTKRTWAALDDLLAGKAPCWAEPCCNFFWSSFSPRSLAAATWLTGTSWFLLCVFRVAGTWSPLPISRMLLAKSILHFWHCKKSIPIMKAGSMSASTTSQWYFLSPNRKPNSFTTPPSTQESICALRSCTFSTGSSQPNSTLRSWLMRVTWAAMSIAAITFLLPIHTGTSIVDAALGDQLNWGPCDWPSLSEGKLTADATSLGWSTYTVRTDGAESVSRPWLPVCSSLIRHWDLTWPTSPHSKHVISLWHPRAICP